jgi:hypothetical protein
MDSIALLEIARDENAARIAGLRSELEHREHLNDRFRLELEKLLVNAVGIYRNTPLLITKEYAAKHPQNMNPRTKFTIGDTAYLGSIGIHRGEISIRIDSEPSTPEHGGSYYCESVEIAQRMKRAHPDNQPTKQED